MTANIPPTCQTCRHWELFCPKGKNSKTEDHGTCRRYPPVLDVNNQIASDLIATDDSTAWAQPVTVAHDTCGEWAPLQEVE